MTIQEHSRVRGFDSWLLSVAAVSTGVNGGVFFAWSAGIMPGLRELPAAQGILAMQAFNDSVVTPPYMLLLYGTAVLCVVLVVRAAMTWRGASAPWVLAAAIGYLLAAVVVTGAVHIPLTEALDSLDPSRAGAPARWDDLFTRWHWWNHVRTLTSIAAAVAFAVALRPAGSRHGATRDSGYIVSGHGSDPGTAGRHLSR